MKCMKCGKEAFKSTMTEAIELGPKRLNLVLAYWLFVIFPAINVWNAMRSFTQEMLPKRLRRLRSV